MDNSNNVAFVEFSKFVQRAYRVRDGGTGVRVEAAPPQPTPAHMNGKFGGHVMRPPRHAQQLVPFSTELHRVPSRHL